MAFGAEVRRFGLALLVIPLAAVSIGVVLLIGRTDVDHANPAEGNTHRLTYDLATAIAFQQGLLRLATPEEARTIFLKERGFADGSELREGTAIPPAFLPTMSRCSDDNASAAIMAVESYLRPTWVRLFEHDLAQTLQTVFGFRPDWSFGPAQMRMGTARRILDTAVHRLKTYGITADLQIDDARLFDLIIDDCAAEELVALAAAVDPRIAVPVPELALRHVGGSPIPTLPGAITYSGVVSTLADEVLSDAEMNRGRLFEDDEDAGYVTEERTDPPPIPLHALASENPPPLYCLNNPDDDDGQTIRTTFGAGPDTWPFSDTPPARLDIGLVGQDVVRDQIEPHDMLYLLKIARAYRDVFDPAGKSPLTFFALNPGRALHDVAREQGCHAVLMDPYAP
ncbi:MAG: hypothetical protein ACT4OK_03070 [Gemmobacter sp.]